jgi:hypothetical protein
LPHSADTRRISPYGTAPTTDTVAVFADARLAERSALRRFASPDTLLK